MGPIERAMKALMEADPDEARFELTDVGSPRYNRVQQQVRAVIAAIREPDAEVSRRAFDSGACGGHDDCWRAMIDKLLEEGR